MSGAARQSVAAALASQAAVDPVLVDPEGGLGRYPAVLVDAMLVRPRPAARQAALTGGGPARRRNVDAVIETNRTFWGGSSPRRTAEYRQAGGVMERTADRMLRAPVDGIVAGWCPSAHVTQGEELPSWRDAVTAPFDGVLRGLVHDGLRFTPV